jgi:hypothetical protein
MTCQNNLLECRGIWGDIRMGGRVAHPPCRYHAAHGCALWARTGGSPWGLRTCPINRASRLAKGDRNRQGRTNDVPLFLEAARYRTPSGKCAAACSLPHAWAGSVLGRSRAAGSQLISRVLDVRLRARASSWSWTAGQPGNRAVSEHRTCPTRSCGMPAWRLMTRRPDTNGPFFDFRLRCGSGICRWCVELRDDPVDDLGPWALVDDRGGVAAAPGAARPAARRRWWG